MPKGIGYPGKEKKTPKKKTDKPKRKRNVFDRMFDPVRPPKPKKK